MTPPTDQDFFDQWWDAAEPALAVGLAGTYYAPFFGKEGDTVEQRLTTAIAVVATLPAGGGGRRLFVPSSMYPYNASLVTFNTAVRMVREGGDPSVYDVQAYGAAGDGVTDDTTACQGAVNTAPPGATVYFPSGSYSITALTVTKRLRIMGDGPERSKLVARAGAVGPLVDLNPVTADNFYALANLKIDLTSATGIVALRVRNLSDSIVTGLEVTRGAVGIDVVLTGTLTIRDCNLRNLDTAGVRIDGDGGGEIYLERCDIIRDIAGTLAVGVQLNRTTTTDTGGLYLTHARVVRGTAGSITRGYELKSTAGSATAVFAMLSACVADGIVTAALDLNNVQNTRAMGSFLTTLAGGSACLITGGQDHTLVGCWLDGGSAGVCLDLASSPLQVAAVGCRFNQGTALRVVGAPSGVVLAGNNYQGATLTNDAASLVQRLEQRDRLYAVKTPAALVAGNNNDYDPGVADTLRLSGSGGGSTVTGISAGSGSRRLRIINLGAVAITLAHQDATSAAANRLVSPTGASVVLAGVDDVADLEYDDSTVRWRIVNVLA